MIELKPCPFCGGEARIVTHLTEDKNTIECRGCGMRLRWFGSGEEAMGSWNSRVTDWHTGIPTEDGWYLVAYQCIYDCKNKGKIEYHALNIITYEDGFRDYRGHASDEVWKAIAWQKILPFEYTSKKISDIVWHDNTKCTSCIHYKEIDGEPYCHHEDSMSYFMCDIDESVSCSRYEEVKDK